MKRELLFSVTLDDCEVQTFRSGGKGGQNQNKRETGVRIIHKPSGAIGESREQRSQLQNKKTAFNRMANTSQMKVWIRKQAAWGGKTPEQMVEASMRKENLLIHTFKNGDWELIG